MYRLIMIVDVQDKLLEGMNLTEDEARLDLAIGLFVDRKATLGRAAIVAGMTQAEFQSEIGKRKIPIHYDLEDLEADIRTIETM
jgi:predicted HTH domain antitoxin